MCLLLLLLLYRMSCVNFGWFTNDIHVYQLTCNYNCLVVNTYINQYQHFKCYDDDLKDDKIQNM